jgi:hypothetical protein
MEQRQQVRRPIKMAVTFFLEGEKADLTDYSFGWATDVSSRGICISTKPNSLPDTGMFLTLLVAPEKENEISDFDILVPIKGKVAWNDPEIQSFGVSFE